MFGQVVERKTFITATAEGLFANCRKNARFLLVGAVGGTVGEMGRAWLQRRLNSSDWMPHKISLGNATPPLRSTVAQMFRILSDWSRPDILRMMTASLSNLDLSWSDLQRTNLTGVDLRGSNLLGVDLTHARLPRTDLRDATLASAVMTEADCEEANLQRSNLAHACLRGAGLSHADLREADLWKADLRDVNLREADLRGANLYGTDLRGADMEDALLEGANFLMADLRNVKGVNLARWSDVRTLFRAQMDEYLEKALQQRYPELLEKIPIH